MGISWGNNDTNNKPKSHKRSISTSTSAATMSTSALPQVHKKLKNEPKNKKNSKSNTSKFLHQQSIHTLTFRVKEDKLSTFSKNNNNNEDIDSDEEFYHPPQENMNLNQDDIKNDGQAIEGKSMNRFFQRTASQEGSSNYSILSQKIDFCLARSKNKSINKKESMIPIVLTHGYGCAGGIFIPSISTIYETLLSRVSVKESPVIHVIDMLGSGMSSRPEFQCETTEETEDWFVESLEEWRKAMGIDKMILAAHSLGGYAIAVYAMRYPQHIEHLVLISPVGVPCRPADADEALKNYSWKVRTMFKTFRHLWNSGELQ